VKNRRQNLLSSVILALIFASSASATGSSIPSVQQQDGRDQSVRLDLDWGLSYIPETNWSDSVMMRRIPRGSLYRNYSGPTRFVLKLARNQVRRFARDYYDHSEDPHKLRLNISGGPVHPWWTREWFDSLPVDQGGAPAAPFPIKPPRASSIAIDVQPGRQPFSSTTVKFKVRPNVRVGMPHLDKGWWSFIRKLAIRADLVIFNRGRVVIQANAEVSYTPGKGVSLKFGVVLGIW